MHIYGNLLITNDIVLEASKSYIQKNPLFGRKVILFERIRESVWDWSLCDATIVTIDQDPGVVRVRGVASSVYEHQGLEEIPVKLFRKIESLAKLYEATTPSVDEQKSIVLRQETLGKIIELLTAHNIIDTDTYNAEHLTAYAAFYEQYSRQQMEHVTDVIDVHK